MAQNHDANKRKKMAVIGVSSLLLVAMVVAVTVGVGMKKGGSGNNNARVPAAAATSKAVEAICQTTDYKQECVDSLKSAGNVTDPKELIKVGFTAAMQYLAAAANKSVTLQELEKEERSAKALTYCKELMDYAIDDIQRSYENLGKFEQVISKPEEFLLDLRIWLSATISYQEACLDGFESTTSDAGQKMKSALNTTMKLTSNALAMVTELPSLLKDLQIPGFNRRLFADGIPVVGHDALPVWFPTASRRLLAASISNIKPNVVVAKDGSGQFTTINQAMKLVPKGNKTPFVIYVKQGVYVEKVLVDKKMTNVMLIGDGATKTRISGKLNFAAGTPTFGTATFAAVGDGFVARDIGFENTAGPEGHQAVALRIQSDRALFCRCSIDGHQDTLYVQSGRQFFRDCTISGTIDFVFGDSAVVFQSCSFLVRKPMQNQRCMVTAQGRKENRQPTGIVIQKSRIIPAADYAPVKAQFNSYLGRPWKQYSRTIIVESFIDDLIHPDGWYPWEGSFALNTLVYAEINNAGPGSDKSKRVKWSGIKRMTTEDAQQFTAGKFLLGDTWIPASGVPYTAGLFGTAA